MHFIEYGGLGLDYKYQAAIIEESGSINCGGIPMAFIVQVEIALPALTRFGTYLYLFLNISSSPCAY
jgi:citronellyl-CoA dehydrogenase